MQKNPQFETRRGDASLWELIQEGNPNRLYGGTYGWPLVNKGAAIYRSTILHCWDQFHLTVFYNERCQPYASLKMACLVSIPLWDNFGVSCREWVSAANVKSCSHWSIIWKWSVGTEIRCKMFVTKHILIVTCYVPSFNIKPMLKITWYLTCYTMICQPALVPAWWNW